MSGQQEIQKKYDALYGDVKGFFLNSTSGKLTAASVTVLTRYAMETVQTGLIWKNLKGSEKKDLVLGVTTAVIEDLLNDPQVVGKDFDENTRQAILAALSLAPFIIDAAVDFAKSYRDSSSTSWSQRKMSLCCF